MLNGYSNFINAVKRQRNLGLGKRETVNAWKKTDFDGFRDKEEKK